jgi:hypothetical protein
MAIVNAGGYVPDAAPAEGVGTVVALYTVSTGTTRAAGEKGGRAF